MFRSGSINTAEANRRKVAQGVAGGVKIGSGGPRQVGVVSHGRRGSKGKMAARVAGVQIA